MSKENVKKFFAAVEQDEKLKAKYIATMKEYHAEAESILTDKLTALGNSVNILFSPEDLKEARAELMDQINENGELADKDLLTVAGGGDYADRKTRNVFGSIFSLGLTCAFFSIGLEMEKKGSCGESITTVNCK